MIVLVMIVKNEARGIRRTLESVRDHVDGWLVLDTGSTDGTQDIVRETMSPDLGELIEEPFVDFSTTRNRALELAERRFGSGTWMLMLSGDAVVEHAENLRTLVEKAVAVDAAAVSIDIRSAGLVYVQSVLTKAGEGCAYRGVTHEVLIAPDGRTYCARGLMEDAPAVVYDGSAADKTARWKLDVELLEADRKVNDDPRSTFYLAQSCECLGEYQRAMALYTERVLDERGYYEERFVAQLRAARCAWRLGRSTRDIILAYEVAHQLCPERAEPLNDLAKYLAGIGAVTTAHGLAQKAAALPFPQRSTLFVEADVYENDARSRLAALDRHISASS